jgi:hypothetical protein
VERFVCACLCCFSRRWVSCCFSATSIDHWIHWFWASSRLHSKQIVAYQSVYDSAARAKFDTDSFKIGIDTLCSITMSGNVKCFENLKPVLSGSVGGIAGGLSIQGTGTFCFKIEDSTGKLHTIKLHNSLYVPNLPNTLLCPQHWSQQDDVEGTFFTAPGSFNYQAFEATYLSAFDASHIRPPTVSIDASQLRGKRPLDPAEFLVTEALNSSFRQSNNETKLN